MSGRQIQDFPQGECGWKVLDKLRRERTQAIENLSSRSSPQMPAGVAGARLPPIESPVPRLMVNSIDLDIEDSDQGPEEKLHGEVHLPSPASGLGKNNTCQVVCPTDDMTYESGELEEDGQKPARSKRDSLGETKPLVRPGFLGIPSATNEEGLLRRRRSVGDIDSTLKNFAADALDRSGRKKDTGSGIGRLQGSPKVEYIPQSVYRSRSPSPSVRKTTSSSAILSPTLSKPKSPQTPTRTSPAPSPEASPRFTCRQSSLSLSQATSPGKGAPTNTQDRLLTRSAHYKLQKFLDENKSQFTTAQTLEVIANSQSADQKHSP